MSLTRSNRTRQIIIALRLQKAGARNFFTP
jgi:hypothetical protein